MSLFSFMSKIICFCKDENMCYTLVIYRVVYTWRIGSDAFQISSRQANLCHPFDCCFLQNDFLCITKPSRPWVSLVCLYLLESSFDIALAWALTLSSVFKPFRPHPASLWTRHYSQHSHQKWITFLYIKPKLLQIWVSFSGACNTLCSCLHQWLPAKKSALLPSLPVLPLARAPKSSGCC